MQDVDLNALRSLDADNHYKLDVKQIKKDIRTQGLEVIIASNPRNPTGQVIQNGELQDLVSLARETTTTLILDEVSAIVTLSRGYYLDAYFF